MSENHESEITLLRKAIARLSDRIEHLEQKLGRIERGQTLSTGPSAAEKEREQRSRFEEQKPPEKAPKPERTRLEIPAVPPPPAAVIPPPILPKQPAQTVPPPILSKPQSETVPPPIMREPPAGTVPPPISARPPFEQVPPPIMPERKSERAPERPAAPPARDFGSQLAENIVSGPEEGTELPGAEQPQTGSAGKQGRDIELNIGKYWLNKIGIGIFVLGVGFLVAYSSQYFGHLGPWGKIVTGFLAAAALFATGRKLGRNEKTLNYSYVLTGGGWALTYFTTFAMQHFPQSRVIESEITGLLLLAAVAAGMLIHSIKYRSEALAGVAIFAGYATATIGDVRYFTLFSCAIESIVILILVYKFNWLRMMFMGILMTYGAHFLWVTKSIHGAVDAASLTAAKDFFVMNATFLTLYWAVFTAGIHLLRKTGEETENQLAVANIGNALFYFLLLYPDITRFFPDQRFNFVVSLGAVFVILGSFLYASGGGKLFACDTMLGLALMTAAVPIKYMTMSTALVWIAELPFLVFAGIELKSRTIRVAAFLLFVWIMLHYAFYVAGSAGRVELAGLGSIPIAGFTAFAAALSFGGVFTMLRRAFARGRISAFENAAAQAFAPAAAVFLYLGTLLTAAPYNLTLYLFLDALLLFAWGFVAGEPLARVAAAVFLGLGVIRFIGIDDYRPLAAFRRWSYISWEILCGYSIYFLYRDLRGRNLLGMVESFLVTATAVGSGLLLLTAVLRYVPENWITFAVSGLALTAFVIGAVTGSQSLRASGLAGSALAAFRYIALDSFPSASFADWLIIAAPPFAQAAIYVPYRYLQGEGKLPETEQRFPDAAYALFQLTLMALAFKYIHGWKMTAAFAFMNLGLFGAGCLLRDKLARCAALAALPVVLCRFIAVDDYAPGARVWPLLSVLGSYYALAWGYVKAAAEGLLEEDELPLSRLVFGAAAFLSAVAVWRYAPENWVAAIFALAGLAAVVYGSFSDSPDARTAGSAFLFTALLRAVFWDDYTSMGRALRWLPVAVQLVSFAAAYWLYRGLRLAKKLLEIELLVSQLVFAGFSALACVSAIRYCPQFWASGSLAVFAAAVFVAGRALDEQIMRLCSCGLFAVVAGRALAFSEDYIALGRLRWLPIGVQLASLSGSYLLYRDMEKKGALQAQESAGPSAVYAGFLFLVIFLIGFYAGDTARPLIFTGFTLGLFAWGALYDDALPRGSWLALVPAVFLVYAGHMPKFPSLVYSAAYAAALSAGMYAVYVLSAGPLKERLSKTEQKFLPALCIAAAATTLLSLSHYSPDTAKTAVAAACLFALYLAGIALRDDTLAFSAYIFVPYIIQRRLNYDSYAGLPFPVKWSAALSAPAAFLGIYLADLKRPGRVFVDAGFQVAVWGGIVPGIAFLLHAIFHFSIPSLVTLSLGVAGLAFFVPGFLFKDRQLRYAGLLMFAAAVLRIAVVDIAGLPIIYKIISFIILGLILLGVSFIYTRFMSDEPPAPDKPDKAG